MVATGGLYNFWHWLWELCYTSCSAAIFASWRVSRTRQSRSWNTWKLELHTNKEMHKELGIDISFVEGRKNRRFEMNFVFIKFIRSCLLWSIMGIGVYLTFRILILLIWRQKRFLPLGQASISHQAGRNPGLQPLLGFPGWSQDWFLYRYKMKIPASWQDCHLDRSLLINIKIMEGSTQPYWRCQYHFLKVSWNWALSNEEEVFD